MNTCCPKSKRARCIQACHEETTYIHLLNVDKFSKSKPYKRADKRACKSARIWIACRVLMKCLLSVLHT